jgi:hypothetical protein
MMGRTWGSKAAHIMEAVKKKERERKWFPSACTPFT